MYDIFLQNANKDSEQYKQLKERFPTLKTAATFSEAQKKCFTKFFWFVWDDLVVEDTFKFDYEPDSGSQEYVHVFLNNKEYDGIGLFPKNSNPTNKEFTYRFFVNKKEVPVVASTPAPFDYFEVDSFEEYEYALENSKTEMFWMSSKNITVNRELIDTFYLTHHNSYDRNENHAFIHDVNERKLYNGLFLCSKNKPLSKREVDFRFIVNRKEWDIIGSTPCKYDIFYIDNYDQYLEAFEKSRTEMFWGVSHNLSFDLPDIYFTHDNEYDRKQNHAFIHRVKDKDLYNGVFLFSKHLSVTKKEIDHRFIVNKKEWDIVASGPCKYEIFKTDTYEDYQNALQSSKTEMFYAIPPYVDINEDFKFDDYFSFDEKFEREINHVYLNNRYHDGVVLCSKYAEFTKREFDYKFIAAKKEVKVLASHPKPYDIVFISYEETNADQNYQRLLDRFPNAKRVHGVKGIHQAHIEAAKLCDTDMFYIVDGDAVIMDDFYFDYQVARWDKETVHVWRSINPINDLVYGYGGAKLFPTELTINMDTTKPDMTTSISSKFKAMGTLSVITGFNTSPFETWKSAFRECAKLSARIIDRQKDTETLERLNTWCTVGKERKYGEYSILGAIAGKEYGELYKDSPDDLRKINDFDWLKEKFNDAN